MRRPFSATILFMVLWVSVAGQSSDNTEYRSLEPYDFHLQYLRDDSSVLIDVREPFEFKGKRIHGAINIPSSGNIDRASDTLNRNFTYFLYCTTDYRSRHVAEKLYDKGFRNLVILDGGIVAWKRDGMKIEKGKISHAVGLRH
jgi:rhodanese-related sulfurtransferase